MFSDFKISHLFLVISVLFASFSFAQTDETTPATEADTTADVQTPVTTQSVVAKLVDASLKEKLAIVEELEVVGQEAVLPLLKAMVNGDLYFIEDTDQAVIAIKVEGTKEFTLTDALSGDVLSDTVTKKEIDKVKTNNRLRSNTRTIIARLSLFSKNVEARKAAVAEIMENLSDDSVALLQEAQAKEKNAKVAEAIKTALAVANLESDNSTVKLAAIDLLSGNLEPVVRNNIERIAKNDKDPVVVKAAEDALKSIEGKIKLFGYIETAFFGLSLGSVLLLVAAGLAITFGVMGVINMAHGEMMMLGAYTTYVIQLLMPNNIALSIFVAIPAAFIVSAVFGILIERGVIQFLKGRPLETLLATFGISLILQQLVRTIFSPLNRQVATPEFMSGAWEINPIFSITFNRLYIIAFAILVFFILQWVLKKTSLGLNVRAVSQNRNMAKAMGIRTEWVDAMTFGLGSGIAGLAGVALSQITNVGPNLGQAYIIDSFMVVVFGGVGNVWGTLVGALSLGVFNKFLEPIIGAVLANIVVLIGIILFIQKRPRGLFPQKGRAAE